MANFFGYRAVYADGHIEKKDGILLWYLGGKPHEENQKKLANLRTKENCGEIERLEIYFES